MKEDLTEEEFVETWMELMIEKYHLRFPKADIHGSYSHTDVVYAQLEAQAKEIYNDLVKLGIKLIVEV